MNEEQPQEELSTGQQDQMPDMSVDDAAAALGFSTTLSDQMLQPLLEQEQMPVEDEGNQTGEEEVPTDPSQEPQNAPQPTEDLDIEEPAPEEEETVEDPNKPLVEMEDRLTKKIEELGKSLKDEQSQGMKKEMDEIKKTLKDLSA